MSQLSEEKVCKWKTEMFKDSKSIDLTKITNVPTSVTALLSECIPVNDFCYKDPKKVFHQIQYSFKLAYLQDKFILFCCNDIALFDTQLFINSDKKNSLYCVLFQQNNNEKPFKIDKIKSFKSKQEISKTYDIPVSHIPENKFEESKEKPKIEVNVQKYADNMSSNTIKLIKKEIKKHNNNKCDANLFNKPFGLFPKILNESIINAIQNGRITDGIFFEKDTCLVLKHVLLYFKTSNNCVTPFVIILDYDRIGKEYYIKKFLKYDMGSKNVRLYGRLPKNWSKTIAIVNNCECEALKFESYGLQSLTPMDGIYKVFHITDIKPNKLNNCEQHNKAQRIIRLISLNAVPFVYWDLLYNGFSVVSQTNMVFTHSGKYVYSVQEYNEHGLIRSEMVTEKEL